MRSPNSRSRAHFERKTIFCLRDNKSFWNWGKLEVGQSDLKKAWRIFGAKLKLSFVSFHWLLNFSQWLFFIFIRQNSSAASPIQLFFPMRTATAKHGIPKLPRAFHVLQSFAHKFRFTFILAKHATIKISVKGQEAVKKFFFLSRGKPKNANAPKHAMEKKVTAANYKLRSLMPKSDDVLLCTRQRLSEDTLKSLSRFVNFRCQQSFRSWCDLKETTVKN